MTKVYAFYLPQFHRVAENDEWWGEGFTEWTTVKNAQSLFPGHEQPRVPLEYYNLLDKTTMKKQADLMHRYGVDGMCFYHYYFEHEKKILEKPAENLLNWKDIDMPFCFYWANQSWIRSWSNVAGGNKWSKIYDESKKEEGDGILLKQDYGKEEEWEKHFYYLLPFFKDSRYIKKERKPIFIIYMPEKIDCLYEMMNYWNNLMKKEGMPDIYFIGNNTMLDAAVCHEPTYSFKMYAGNRFNNDYGINNIISYEEIWNTILQNGSCSEDNYLCGCSGFDDSPRHGKTGIIVKNGTPEKFKNYMIRLLTKAEKSKSEFVFVNAWNEWGEGMYLEPDVKWGTGYLEALRDAKRFVCENREILLGILEDNTGSNFIKGENVISRKEERYKEYWQVLDQWLKFEIAGNSIAQYLRKQSYDSAAIYGLGMLGTSLVMDLEREGIEIKYGIDQDIYKGRQFEFPVYTLENELPEVQIIIVTTTGIFHSVNKKLRSRSNAKIISLRAILGI